VKGSALVQNFIAAAAILFPVKTNGDHRLADVQVAERNLRKPLWQVRIDKQRAQRFMGAEFSYLGTVYVLGAGASYGEALHATENPRAFQARLVTPPLVKGFFEDALFQRIGYIANAAAEDFKEAFDYVRSLKLLTEVPGTGGWNGLGS
jgi:hypothetical protein